MSIHPTSASTSSASASGGNNSNNHNNSNNNAITTLPRTIEGAVARYMNVYKTNFVGQDLREMNRLKDLLEVKLAKLRRKAPEFYDKRLCPLIIQAASTLLTCNMRTNLGQKKFNETHRELCIVLDNLLQTQPAGEADFPTERRRVQERDSLNRQHIELRKKLDELDATELDLYDEDELTQFYSKREKLERDLSAVCKLIAEIEGENIDKLNRKFVLAPHTTNMLSRLTPDQFEHLETQISEYLIEEGPKHTMDKGVVDVFIERLDLSDNNFTKEDLVDLAKDTLDAIREFYRECEYERVNEFHDAIMNSDILKPKEGLILKSFNDVPPEIAEKLNKSAKRLKRQIDETLEKFAEKQGEHYNAFGDDVNERAVVARRPDAQDLLDDAFEDLANESDDDLLEQEAYEKAFINKYKQDNPELFARVKEEPRDDYTGDCPSEEEIELEEEDAQLLDPELTRSTNAPPNHEVVVSTAQNSSSPKSTGTTAESNKQSTSEPEVIEIGSDTDDEEAAPSNASLPPPKPSSNISKPQSKEKQPIASRSVGQRAAPPGNLSNKSSTRNNNSQLPQKPSIRKPNETPRQSSESSGVFNDEEDDDDDEIQELGVVEPSAKRPCIQLE